MMAIQNIQVTNICHCSLQLCFSYCFFSFLYTLLLIFGQHLKSLPKQKGLRWIHSTAIFSVLDAYHAPYSPHHRYWTGLGLIVRCCLFAIFSTSYNMQKNRFWINITLIILLCYSQIFCRKIYPRKFCDLLELFYLVNMATLSATLLYSDNLYPLTVSVVLALLVFLVTFMYHITLLVRDHFNSDKVLKNIFIKLKQNSRVSKKKRRYSSRMSKPFINCC